MTNDDSELAFLADYVQYPDETRRCIEKYLVEEDAFANADCKAAFRRLNDAKDDALLQGIVADVFKFDNKKLCAFLERADAIPAYVPDRAHKLGMALYNRRVREAAIEATNSFADCADGASLQEKVALAIAAIPKPPSLNEKPDEAVLAERLRADAEEDIPDELLHVPGFVDALVEHSLASAYKPNRTLSFAGALALAAHLMGRRYTDGRDTRTNLFVFALGPTGIGKEHVRKTNLAVLKACCLDKTVFGQVSSGESIEETLYCFPCTLFQIDEVQKLLQSLKDERNATSLGIAKFLMMLYSASGDNHTLRPKATAPDAIGRTISDPSLTIFATGTSKDSFRALTPSVIKEGLLGRCLMFDSEVEGADNAFENGRPALPNNVVAMAQEMAEACCGRGSGREPFKPELVPYADGVNARINAINAEITKLKKACRAKGDETGEALWARAPEKVGKLALVYAVSETRAKPVIRMEAVEWAWKLVKFLIERMVRRVETYMTNGKVDEDCRKVLDYLVARGGRCTQRELMRAKKFVDGRDFDSVVATLEKRGQITVTKMSRNSVVFTLVDQK